MESVAESEADDEHRIRFGSGCLKSLLVIINLLFMIGGLALIGLAVWIHLYRESFVYYRIFEDAPSSLTSHPAHHTLQQQQQQQQQQHIPSNVIHKTLVIVVVALVAVIVASGFLGCCGASVESICFLFLCIVLIVSVVIAEIVIASMIPGIKNKMYNDLLRRMEHQVRAEYNRTTRAVTEHQTLTDLQQLTIAWDNLQIRFNCCGASGSRDFLTSVWYNQTKDNQGMFVPLACCILLEPDPIDPDKKDDSMCQIEAIFHDHRQKAISELQALRTTGCHEALVIYVDSFLRHPLIIAVYSLIIILQLIDLLFCCILILWIRRKLSEIANSDNEESEQEQEDSEEEKED